MWNYKIAMATFRTSQYIKVMLHETIHNDDF